MNRFLAAKFGYPLPPPPDLDWRLVAVSVLLLVAGLLPRRALRFEAKSARVLCRAVLIVAGLVVLAYAIGNWMVGLTVEY